MSLIICVFICLRKISGLEMDGERKGFYICRAMHFFPCSISCKDIWGWFSFMVRLLYMNTKGNLKHEQWCFLLKQCWGTGRNRKPIRVLMSECNGPVLRYGHWNHLHPPCMGCSDVLLVEVMFVTVRGTCFLGLLIVPAQILFSF